MSRWTSGAVGALLFSVAAWWLSTRQGLTESDERVAALLTPPGVPFSFELGLGPEPLLFSLQALIGASLLWLGIRGVLRGGR